MYVLWLILTHFRSPFSYSVVYLKAFLYFHLYLMHTHSLMSETNVINFIIITFLIMIVWLKWTECLCDINIPSWRQQETALACEVKPCTYDRFLRSLSCILRLQSITMTTSTARRVMMATHPMLTHRMRGGMPLPCRLLLSRSKHNHNCSRTSASSLNPLDHYYPQPISPSWFPIRINYSFFSASYVAPSAV